MTEDPWKKGSGLILAGLFWLVVGVMCPPLALIVALIIFAVKYAKSEFRR